jgi:flagella basal body P-ring formation protein FlgA
MFCALFCQTSANIEAKDLQKDLGLQVYLPREITIKDDTISLGEVSIIRGDPCEGGLQAKASKIPLGRISVPGQKIVIDKSMILSRLACNGIPASQVTLTGAEKITIKREHKIIKGSEFVELAGAFLKENPPSGSVCEWEPIRIPKDLIVPEKSKNIKLVPHLAKNAAKNQARIEIAVVQDGKAIEKCEVIFRLKYKCHRVVTLVGIPAGEVISSKNVKIEDSVANFPEPVDWKPPYGLVARRPLAANTVLQANMVGPVKPEVVIERNQNVVIRIERQILVVTAMGKAMQDGREGEYIKVRNQDSQRIILAKVKGDGTVEPIF